MLAAVGFSLGPALVGLSGTSDLCEPIPPPGKRIVDQRYENVIDLVIVECTVEYGDGEVVEETEVNWEGGISAIFFPIGVFFGSAGLLGLVDRRKAAMITAACVVICFAMVVSFFV